MTTPVASTGGTDAHVAIRLERIDQLFDPLDPAPTPTRRLAPNVCQYLSEGFEDAPKDAPAALRIELAADERFDRDAVTSAIRGHFARLAVRKSRELRKIYLSGTVMVLIGVICAVLLINIAGKITASTESRVLLRVASTITVLVWVILWRPFETIIYGPVQVRSDFKTMRKLSALEVVCTSAGRGGGRAS